MTDEEKLQRLVKTFINAAAKIGRKAKQVLDDNAIGELHQEIVAAMLPGIYLTRFVAHFSSASLIE